MVRPYKYSEPITVYTTIGFTAKTHEKLRQYSEATGLTIADIVRRKMMGLQMPKANKELLNRLDRLLCLIAKNGGLLKLAIKKYPEHAQEISTVIEQQKKFYANVDKEFETLKQGFRRYTAEKGDDKNALQTGAAPQGWQEFVSLINDIRRDGESERER